MSEIYEVFKYFAKANGVTPQEALGMSFHMELWEKRMINSGHLKIPVPKKDNATKVTSLFTMKSGRFAPTN